VLCQSDTLVEGCGPYFKFPVNIEHRLSVHCDIDFKDARGDGNGRSLGSLILLLQMSNAMPASLVSSDTDQPSAVATNEDELRREVEFLKQKINELQSTASQKGALPLPSLSSSLTTMAPPEKSGYLFKWQDRSIGWGGTKW